ncbi:MAG: acetyl-CoA carboxylase biotin carboxylase subunit [Candidatus Omnitrophica bacterium CG11_big_fil_rev_8_21_14_0_20_42_13]|uniref:Biotin carboxylase n=1 Tax=Candidatus Ghiorseimicrobium undicola TaxID=1974746 RepID=A0A2H0LZZ1_9BACT|nr:MAG: acetyl-CoA carboxylase biotin carboxylase subunit [Candidatus Omnitrophica bacterium CG11_big_fil_rev_8_21_14_0_20_42_13]
MFSKILIANRGEIALRIIRACKEMGIKTVAVYSEADKDSLHVRFADEAVCIGAAAPANSYLNIPAIISAAEITDVEAIHPGYGFLAENSHFAEICESCQITFIGPSPESMKMLSDKMSAREVMRKAGLPILSGSSTLVKCKEDALKVAHKIKYPVIIKASWGGGGRGMRIAHNDIRLVSSLMTAQAEAEAAFGKPDIYIEKYINQAKHIEFQILADNYGNIVHLGERDCSIQRRHQKLLEESPSPALNSKLRKKMGEAAIKGAKAVNYQSAGTVEFLLDADKTFYFMELNKRIQVEHPVTEVLYDVDLIKWQIRIAAGEKLTLNQETLMPNGASIECRINAENPDNNFIPSPGRIEALNLPAGPKIRVDTHVYQGYNISPYYDSMVAKVIAHGKDRNEAILIMKRALDELIIEPVKTTTHLHKQILDNRLFQEGEVYTNFLENIYGVKFDSEE